MKDASRDLFMALNYLVVNNSSSAKGRVVLLTSLHNIGYKITAFNYICLLYTSPSPRDQRGSRMPSSA